MRIWTIGHSTRAIDEFISLLKENEIKLLADIRAWPGSKRYPQFNKDALAELLNAHGVRHEHFLSLGANENPSQTRATLRGVTRHSAGTPITWRRSNSKKGIERLLDVAGEVGPTAIMCAEAVWWRCHRSLIADYLKVRAGWKCCTFSAQTKSSRIRSHLRDAS